MQMEKSEIEIETETAMHRIKEDEDVLTPQMVCFWSFKCEKEEKRVSERVREMKKKREEKREREWE